MVGEEVEGEDYGAVGGVLEGDDALGRGAGLNRGEDVFDAACWDEFVVGLFRESERGRLRCGEFSVLGGIFAFILGAFVERYASSRVFLVLLLVRSG